MVGSKCDMTELDNLKSKSLSNRFESFLEEEVNKIMVPNGISPGIAIAYGSSNKFHQLCFGENGNGELLDENTEFDLASVTKLFVGLVYMYLIQNNYISGKEKISDCTSRYSNIGSLLLVDLLSYNVILETEQRLDTCLDYEKAFEILESVKGKRSELQVYSDIPALVLGDILSDFTDKTFGQWVDCLFIERFNLSGLLYKKSLGRKYVSYDNEYTFSSDGLIRKENPIGIVNDPKSRILMEKDGYLTGNAGLFCSTKDIIKICQSILSDEIISHEFLKKMVLGNETVDYSSSQPYGYMCYRKIDDKIKSEIPGFVSDYAFASSGFTGCYLMIDIFNDIFVFIGGNRLNNSVSKILSKEERSKKEFDYNGDIIKSGLDYVYKRDSLRDLLCCKALVSD